MSRANVVLAVSLVGLFAPLQSSAVDTPDKPALVRMQAALDIDREGRVTAVTFVDDMKLPDAIRQRAEQVAKGWQFLPPTKGGEAVAGRTYADMQACVVPKDGGADFTVAYSGNGPGTFYRAPRKPISNVLPLSKLMTQGVSRLSGTIIYVVSVDGKAELQAATLDDPKLQKQYGDLWKRQQRELQKNFHYLPEMIDGVPIATRVETRSVQEWFKADDRKAAAAVMQERDEQSDACKALRGDNGRLIASDSPFKRMGG